MGIYEWAAAKEALDRWDHALTDDAVALGMALPWEMQQAVSETLVEAVEAVTSLMLSIPDLSCSEDAVIIEAEALAERSHASFANDDMHELVAAFERHRDRWVDIRQARDAALAQADEWAVVADERRRSGTVATAKTRAMAVEDHLTLGRQTRSWPAHMRLARVGAEVFGVRFLVDSVLAIYSSAWDDELLMQMADASLDELASLAASTEPEALSAPQGALSIASEARRALLSLAGYPELTSVALARVPHHRIEAADVEILKRLVADRAEVFDERFAEGLEQARSVAGELALMRAMDAAGIYRSHDR